MLATLYLIILNNDTTNLLVELTPQYAFLLEDHQQMILHAVISF